MWRRAINPQLGILRIRAWFGKLSPIALLVFGWPRQCWPFCQLPYPPRVCAEFYVNDAVFTGEAVSSQYLADGLTPDKDPGDGWLYHLKVLKVYRGKLGPGVQVYTENASARYELERRNSNLLFAFWDKAKKSVLDVYGCSLSKELSKSGGALRKIHQILTAKPGSGGQIDGQFDASGYKNPGGIRIVARSREKTYETVTSKDGRFNMRVPAGVYDLTATSPDWYIGPDQTRSLYPHKNITSRMVNVRICSSQECTWIGDNFRKSSHFWRIQ